MFYWLKHINNNLSSQVLYSRVDMVILRVCLYAFMYVYMCAHAYAYAHMNYTFP